MFLCLLDFPYSYYLFVRWSAMFGFGFLAYSAYQNKKEFLTIIFVLLAILFQPFEKFVLGRTLWNVVDVVVGVGLIISIIFPIKKKD